jgi:hypothetical protein
MGEPLYLSPRVDPWAYFVIPRTYFRENIPHAGRSPAEKERLCWHNLMMLAIVAIYLAVIHVGFDEEQRTSVRRWLCELALMKKDWCG